MLIKIITWPGRMAVRYLPPAGEEETRLVHNIVNYIVWIGLLVVLTLVLVSRFPPV